MRFKVVIVSLHCAELIEYVRDTHTENL